MTEGPKCACCKTNAATLRLTEPTDASAERGTLYCDYCSTATSAGFERIDDPVQYADLTAEDLEYGEHNPGIILEAPEPETASEEINQRVAYLTRLQSDAAGNALEAIKKLRRDLDSMEAAILAGENGEPVRQGDLTPYHQTLSEVVAYGTEFRTLWNAVGLLNR